MNIIVDSRDLIIIPNWDNLIPKPCIGLFIQDLNSYRRYDKDYTAIFQYYSVEFRISNRANEYNIVLAHSCINKL